MTNKTKWLTIYGVAMTLSFIIVSTLGAEIYYRDRYYRESAQNGPTIDPLLVLKNINAKHEKAILDNRISYSKFCDSLSYTPKNKESCEQFFAKKQAVKILIDESDEKILKIFQSRNTESEKYEEFMKGHELGYGFDWTQNLGTPYMFILMFACIGLGASTLGSLLVLPSNFDEGQEIERASALILGPVTAMLTALFLVYVFVPNERVDAMFSKRLLNVPVSVYIFSFLFSVSPTNSISNLAEFSRKQISMLAGKRTQT